MSETPQSLDDIRTDIDRRLVRGARKWRDAMHDAVVATTDADARVMILRAYDTATRTLRFHTDIRSPKAQVIGSGAPVGVLFYDKGAKIQIRCKGQGRIERDGGVADAAWESSTNFAKRCYLGEGPGAISDVATSGLPDWAEGLEPTPEQVAPGRENFAVLLVEARHFDWLYLAHTGHMRAQFEGGTARWATP
ncbi:PNPOx family protein [Parerythrobacter jejuensis]|uniref:Flavin-binding protein n=1 Tax=Parerythrobacter jejuensis TaxID=795812 RepID=A0A845AQJ3_9SPHN|nr:pyridoxamine 5'-phosphate oxidase family protein [Parerythrobacter jejuensis]MXP31884.1 flavin-binding protein [Parerythrobacter jejuensis]